MSSPVNNTFRLPVQPPRRHHRLLPVLLVLAWLAALALIALNRQNILDWWKLRQYQAPAAISSLAAQDTMTGYGRKIFYVNHPVIDDKTAFTKACPDNGGEQTIVLGCYHGGQSGIFLLKVNDPRLDGVLQVTAAHELLHGAYERLDTAERKKVDAMLLDYYNNHLDDPRIAKTIASYKKSEPRDVVNEMHSVFGTEIANLPQDLEQYYKKYFTNRAQIAAYAADYQSEFTGREELVAQYDAQLADLKSRIDSGQNSLQAKQAEITDRQNQLQAKKNGGDIAGYNAGVPGYNALVNEYNATAQNVKSLITQYNQLVEKRNEVALEEDQLVKSLSNDTAPIR
jgi:Skp family chaperone for outer membrane proteins